MRYTIVMIATTVLLHSSQVQAQTRNTPPAASIPGLPDSYTRQYAYQQAISTYIDTFINKKHPRPDTLLIVHNSDMHINMLPAVINGVNIVFLPNRAAERWKRNKTGQICLNVIGWPEPKEASFIVVSFLDWKPQHNCHIHFVSDGHQRLRCDKLHVEYPYRR